MATLVTVPVSFAFILLDNDAVSAAFNLRLIRFDKEAVSVVFNFVFILLDNETVSAETNVPTLIFPEPNKLFEFTVFIFVPDTKVFCFVLNLDVRFNKDVSVNSIKTLRSAETVPVVVIGSGETRIPVPPEIEVKLPDPPPLPAPPPRGKITV